MFNDYILLLFTTQPRRAKGLFNVLRGRRTVSTLFAGLTYGVLDQLDAWHGVPLAKFSAATDDLVTAGWLSSPTEGYLQLTASGQVKRQQLVANLYQPQAWRQFQLVDVRRFAALSQLALQVVSEAAHGQNRYYPVTTDPGLQAPVKAWFRRVREPQLGAQLYQQLHAFLATLTPELAGIFVQSLTGYEFPGQTDAQLAQQFDRQTVELLVIRKDLTCQWIVWLRAHQQDVCWPLLAPLIKQTAASSSAWQTYQDYLTVGDLDQIATQRHLKISTVREHLLEVAILEPRFPFERLLTPERLAQLTPIFADQPDVSTWQFTQVQAVAPTVDFFWFRLLQIMRCQIDG